MRLSLIAQTLATAHLTESLDVASVAEQDDAGNENLRVRHLVLKGWVK